MGYISVFVDPLEGATPTRPKYFILLNLDLCKFRSVLVGFKTDQSVLNSICFFTRPVVGRFTKYLWNTVCILITYRHEKRDRTDRFERYNRPGISIDRSPPPPRSTVFDFSENVVFDETVGKRNPQPDGTTNTVGVTIAGLVVRCFSL